MVRGRGASGGPRERDAGGPADRRWTRRELLGATGVLALASGCLGAVSGSNGFDVGMRAVAYAPPELEVGVGETVVWKNTSSRSHTVTAYADGIPADATYFASGGFENEAAAREAWRDRLGGSIASGDTYEHTFEVPGTYSYFCIPHEQGGMVGVVRVSEE